MATKCWMKRMQKHRAEIEAFTFATVGWKSLQNNPRLCLKGFHAKSARTWLLISCFEISDIRETRECRISVHVPWLYPLISSWLDSRLHPQCSFYSWTSGLSSIYWYVWCVPPLENRPAQPILSFPPSPSSCQTSLLSVTRLSLLHYPPLRHIHRLAAFVEPPMPAIEAYPMPLTGPQLNH